MFPNDVNKTVGQWWYGKWSYKSFLSHIRTRISIVVDKNVDMQL